MNYRRYRRRRVRSFSEVKADIEAHNLRYLRHLEWEERNTRFREKFHEYGAPYHRQIEAIRNDKKSYERVCLGLFPSSELLPEKLKLIEQLREKIKEAEKRALREAPEPNFPYERFPNGREIYYDWKSIPIALEKELNEARKKEKRRTKDRLLKARAAQADKKTRDLASSVKNTLPKDDICPYCGKLLGETPHADHIYPVAKGGLSTPSNMVYVCARCNSLKRDMTLREFIIKYSFDRKSVESRLSELRKDF